MVDSVKKFTIRTVAALALGAVLMTSPASAHCSDGHRHWVGMAGYYGVPWAYSDFFDSDTGCRNSSAYDRAPGGIHAKGHAASCARIYRTYDPASATYIGADGLNHPCP
jgi:BA14K-like protein